jgi:hypothetical protein
MSGFSSMTRYLVIAVFTLSMMLADCSTDTTGAEVKNERVCLYMPDGKTPAAGAVVQLVPVAFIPGEASAILFSTITDGEGAYSVNGIPPGMYNVFARKDSLASYNDSIYIGNTMELRDATGLRSATGLRNDTLESSERIRLRVQLQPNHNPRSVIVQVLGSTISYENVDSTGAFVLSDLASGDYRLRLTTTIGGYTPTFISLHLPAGSKEHIDSAASPTTDTVILNLKIIPVTSSDSIIDITGNPIELIYTGIPVVTGLQASFDQVYSTITVTWDAARFQDFLDYVVYRERPDDRSLSQEWVESVKENRFADSIGYLRLQNETRTLSLRYRVAIRDKSLNIGETFGFITINATLTPSTVTLFQSATLPFTPNEPVLLAIRPEPAVSGNLRYFWSIGSAREYTEVSGPETTMTVALPGDSIIDSLPCRAKIISDGGAAFFDTLYLQSQFAWEKIADAPVKNARSFHAVPFNDAIMLFCEMQPTDSLSMHQVWNSANGIDWRQVGGPVPFTSNCTPPLVFDGRLRVLVRDAATSDAVLWSSDDGATWDSTRIPGLSLHGYRSAYDAWAAVGDSIVLVNYYPPCLPADGCASGEAHCWTSANGSEWLKADLAGSLFPDRYDEPNEHFAATDYHGALVIAGAWRTAYLTDPPNAAYKLRIWNDPALPPREIGMPVVGQDGVFSEYYPSIVTFNGHLTVALLNANYTDPHTEVWTLQADETWHCCSDRCPAEKPSNISSPYHTLVIANGSLLSISTAGIWRVKR